MICILCLLRGWSRSLAASNCFSHISPYSSRIGFRLLSSYQQISCLTIRQYKLSNGLVVALQNTPTQTVAAKLRINYGSSHEKEGEESFSVSTAEQLIEQLINLNDNISWDSIDQDTTLLSTLLDRGLLPSFSSDLIFASSIIVGKKSILIAGSSTILPASIISGPAIISGTLIPPS